MKASRYLHIKKAICVLLYIIGISLSAQEKDTIIYKDGLILYKGDTVTIDLEEVRLLKRLKFDNYKERRYYYWFRKKVLRAYPYAKLASERLLVLNKRLDAIKSKRKKKKYTRRIHKYMEQEFTPQLKKLTRTEGRVLIKLVHRQTGKTIFELVKEYRSGWRAFWYNTTAKMFKLSLKSEYHPETVKEDFLIEDIIQRAFVNGVLEEQKPALNIDYYELEAKWNKKRMEKRN